MLPIIGAHVTTTPRKKRVWSVQDFARHAYGEDDEAACRRARRFLMRLDAKHEHKLLLRTSGANRGYSFMPATLARLEPDLFEPVESLEFRVEAVEEKLDELTANERMIVSQVKQNSRDIAVMRMRRSNGAGRINA